MRTAVTVRSALRTEVVTLDRACEALTNGSALHVHLLAHCEQFSDRQSSASSVLTGNFSRHGEFAGHFTGFDTCLGKVAGLGLGHARSAARTERDLQGHVAIVLLGFDLSHTVVGHIHHRDGHCVPVISEQTHHAHLATQQPQGVAQTHLFAPKLSPL
ncbi:hypothetical protein D3C79_844890 [compost metagenome]